MRRRGVALAVVAALALPGAANAASGWVPGFDEVAPSGSISSPAAVVTQDLRTVVVWTQDFRIRAAVRPRGGTFGDPFVVDPESTNNSYVPQYLNATALPDGDVLVTWSGPDFNYPAFAKLLHPDGTVTDAVSIEAGGFHPAVAVNSAGRIALAYYTFNEVKVLVRPAGSATFNSAVSLLTLSSSPAESSNSLDVTLRDSDDQIAAAIGTKGINPPSPAQARLVIVRRTAAGANSTEFVDSRTLSLSPPSPGQHESAQYDGRIEQLSDGSQVLVYRLTMSSFSSSLTREIHGGKRNGTSGASPTIDSGNPNNSPSEHGLVVDDAGRPSTWWRNDLGADQGLKVSRASTAGVFGASEELAADAFGPVGFDTFGNGRTGLLFTKDGKEQASISEAGAAFSTPVLVATPASVPSAFSKVALAGAGEGSAVAVWQDGATTGSAALNATPFDATAPTLGALQGPDALTEGVAGMFSTSALDDWSTPSISWLFSDGATQSGPSVQHAFGTAGSFTATATATDAVGNTAGGARTVTVTPAPSPVVETAPTGDTLPVVQPPPPDKTPPTIKLALTKQNLLKALKKGYFAFFLDNELGNGLGDLFASGKDAKGAAVRKRVGHGTLKITKTGKQKLVVRFTRKAKKAFKKRRKVTLSLVLVVKDATGNATTKTAKVILKR